ncbi:hypothetical protein [Spiroplasma endosymbiont of Asaphidion curtum]
MRFFAILFTCTYKYNSANNKIIFCCVKIYTLDFLHYLFIKQNSYKIYLK